MFLFSAVTLYQTERTNKYSPSPFAIGSSLVTNVFMAKTVSEFVLPETEGNSREDPRNLHFGFQCPTALFIPSDCCAFL
jgi:hypothetical protein